MNGPVRDGFRWRMHVFWQKPNFGSRWYRGNFTLGLAIDSHPRFVNVIVSLVFVEIGIAFRRERLARRDAERIGA